MSLVAVESTAELASASLNLGPLSIATLRTHESPLLREAMRLIIEDAAAGQFGDSVQGQRD